VLALVPKRAPALGAATVRTVCEQPHRQTAHRQPAQGWLLLAERFPAVVRRLESAEEERLPFDDVPRPHRRQISRTNPLERLNKDLQRRSAVGGHRPPPGRRAVLVHRPVRRAAGRGAGGPAVLERDQQAGRAPAGRAERAAPGDRRGVSPGTPPLARSTT
jgi:hypothetical protein